ncbi:amino acid racemase [Endozoicomonas sp. Mp262]|uniref:aspartate/glutamate racemase family protein n=1 Tax=Endozoicomonas sp. Mp262 TaxID=2919499 RepID=UPI0021D9E9EA
MLGILGGMGPLATVDFMQKLIACTTVSSDQEHIPMLVHNVPQIPDRSACILKGAEDPFPALYKGLRNLEASGAQCVVMPCNTAHYWFDRLSDISRVPMISIIDCVEHYVEQQGFRQVGLMATSATVAAGMYRQRLACTGKTCIEPDSSHQQQLMTAIYNIKAGQLESGHLGMNEVFNALINKGADAVILGCTEIPVGLEIILKKNPRRCIDATALLAQACVDWYHHQQALAA